MFSSSSWAYAAVGGALALWAPFWQGVDWGQPVGVIALLAVALWHFARQQRPLALGIVLGTACLVRPFLVAAAAATGAWPLQRILTAALASIVAAGMGFLLVGVWPATWLHKAALAGQFTSACGSLPGVLGMSTATGTTFFFASLALLAAVFRLRGATDGAVGIALTAAMLSYPLAWFQYDVTLIPVVVWVAANSHRTNERWALWAAVLFLAARSLPNLSADARWQLWVQCGGRLVLLAGAMLVERKLAALPGQTGDAL
jgi:hypothetical protein